MVIQNKRRRRQSKIQRQSTIQSLFNTNDNQMQGRPKLSRLPSDQGFCSPANQRHICHTSPAVEKERENRHANITGWGPRPARVVTLLFICSVYFPATDMSIL